MAEEQTALWSVRMARAEAREGRTCRELGGQAALGPWASL